MAHSPLPAHPSTFCCYGLGETALRLIYTENSWFQRCLHWWHCSSVIQLQIMYKIITWDIRPNETFRITFLFNSMINIYSCAPLGRNKNWKFMEANSNITFNPSSYDPVDTLLATDEEYLVFWTLIEGVLCDWYISCIQRDVKCFCLVVQRNCRVQFKHAKIRYYDHPYTV